MEIYSNVFNGSAIYNTLFLKIFTVTEYANVDEFGEHNPNSYDEWSHKNYVSATNMDDQYQKECLTPEYSKIIGVTFCTVSNKNGEMKRNFQNIYNPNDEAQVIREIFTVFNDGLGKLANPLMCGHNIIGYDIPFLVKRAIKHNIKVPDVLKKAFNSKPWESIALDTMLLWQFGGKDYRSLNEIAIFAGLKYKNIPMDEFDMNQTYWCDTKEGNVWYENEIMNKVNLTLQLLIKLSDM